MEMKVYHIIVKFVGHSQHNGEYLATIRFTRITVPNWVES